VKSILLAGGVSANTVLREKVKELIEKTNFEDKPEFFVPPVSLCTDNAIYIASCAHFNSVQKTLDEVNVNPGLSVMDRL
jgi:N6-L-threonylcarbamoyladenine synthase